MSGASRVTLVLVVDIGPEAVAAFQRYEAAVLPLLERHGGRLERRLRTADERTEVHVLSFASRSAYEGYLADPARIDQRVLVEGMTLDQRLFEVADVDPAEPAPS